MTKRLLIFLFTIAFLSAIPAVAGVMANHGIAQQEQIDNNTITISVEGSTLTISGAQGKTLEVVSLTGRVLKTVKINSSVQSVNLVEEKIQKGCYILKIDSIVRKVSIC